MKLISKKLAAKAIDFNTLNAEGNSVALSGYQGKSNVFLVFNRGFS